MFKPISDDSHANICGGADEVRNKYLLSVFNEVNNAVKKKEKKRKKLMKELKKLKKEAEEKA